MPATKKSTLWSTLALVVSVLSVLAMAAILFGYYREMFTFREASGHLRIAAQFSVCVLGFSALVALLSWKNKASLIKALIAAVIVLAPLLVLKNNSIRWNTALIGIIHDNGKHRAETFSHTEYYS